MLLAAARLRVGGRRLRALARGEDESLRSWIAQESAGRLAAVRVAAHDDALRLEGLGARIVTLEDREFPPGLRDLKDPPAFLTVRGTLPAGGIAIVGSRTPSLEAAAFARALAARLGEPIIAGLALGVDSAVHEGALEAGTSTVAYLGTGIDVVYPPENEELAERIAGAGAVATEFLPGSVGTRWSLVRRDRLQAAHARATFLVTSEPDGGALHTMRFAAELGRARFVLDPADPAVQAGNLQAHEDGATSAPRDVEAAARMLLAR